MRTRRESAEERRKVEEEIKRVDREKREKTQFKRRKQIGPYDIPVDPNLPKVYINPADVKNAEVKVEVKEELLKVMEGHLEGDGVFEAFQENEVIEEEDKGIGDETTKMVIDPADLGEAEVKIEIKEEALEVIDQLEEDAVIEEFQQDEVVVEEEEKKVNEETQKKILRLVMPLLEQNDVFRCRLVNKQWRRIVDDFIEDSVVPKPYDDEAYLEKLKRFPYQMCPLPQFEIKKITYKFEEEAELEKFNEAMKWHMESELSPFIGGATVILNNLLIKSPSPSVLSPATQLFLEKFGVHIRRLGIIHKNEEAEERGNLDIVGYVNFVKKCSHFVPNLEKLKIKCSDFVDKNNPSTPMADLKATLYRNELFDRMPKLNKLTSLEFDFADNFVRKIFADIMIKPYYQTQLKQLSLNSIEELADLQVDNVKELNISNLMLWKLNKVKVESHAEKLTFLFFDLNQKDDMTLKFPNLRYLRLSLCNWSRCLNGLNANWQRANIHTLELMDFDEEHGLFPKLNRAFPHLRHLIIRNHEIKSWMAVLSGSTGGEMKLKHLFDADTSYRTNLWEILPELEVITLQFRDNVGYSRCDSTKGKIYLCPFKNIVETRQGYEKFILKEEKVSNYHAKKSTTETLGNVNNCEIM